MKKLLIAEKPSLARHYQKALEAAGEKFKISDDKEYSESQNYIVVSQFGHLIELKMPGDYNEELQKWSLDTLPFFPQEYQYNIKKDCSKRVNTIKKLTHRSDVSEILHAGDPDREGQVLVDIVLDYVSNEKPVSRVWSKALDADSINEALSKVRPNNEYTLIKNEGLARSFADYNFGINLSRYVTIKANARPALNVGRLKGAILQELYNREEAIKNFVPEKFYKLVSEQNGFTITATEKFKGEELDKAVEFANKLNAEPLIVKSKETKETKKSKPKLFNQTSLQGFMNKAKGFSPDKTLAICQKLYDETFISYPRTSSEYLLESEKSDVEKIISKLNKSAELKVISTKSVFDNSKIDGHSALIPTGTLPHNLTAEEQDVYNAIFNRFCAVFCAEDCLYDKTEIVLANSFAEFKLSGEILKQSGWQKYERTKTKDKDQDQEQTLPPLEIGDKVSPNFIATPGETKAPARYTVDSFGKFMENPFAKNETSDEDYYKNVLAGLSIGTEATRATTIAELRNKDYIEQKSTNYKILDKGIYLVKTCQALGIDFSKELTANLNAKLHSISKGELTIQDFLQEQKTEITNIITNSNATQIQELERTPEGIFGTCPICGKPAKKIKAKTGKTYIVCSQGKETCSFILADMAYGKKLTDSQLKTLLSGKQTNEIKGFTSTKTGKKYNACLKLEITNGIANTKLIFN